MDWYSWRWKAGNIAHCTLGDQNGKWWPIWKQQAFAQCIPFKTQVQSLKHVSEDQISNFFATYVRAFRASLRNINQDLDGLELSLEYFSRFWGLCSAQYSNQIAGNVLCLFQSTITKLDNIDIPLCLWIFLAGSNTSSFAQMENVAVEQLYLAMEAELNVRLPDQDRRVLPVFMTVQFLLSARHMGFFNILHDLMRAQGRLKIWECVWRVCQRSWLYTVMSQHAELHAEMFESMLSIVMAQRWLWIHCTGLWLGLLSIIRSLRYIVILVRDPLNRKNDEMSSSWCTHMIGHVTPRNLLPRRCRPWECGTRGNQTASLSLFGMKHTRTSPCTRFSRGWGNLDAKRRSQHDTVSCVEHFPGFPVIGEP